MRERDDDQRKAAKGDGGDEEDDDARERCWKGRRRIRRAESWTTREADGPEALPPTCPLPLHLEVEWDKPTSETTRRCRSTVYCATLTVRSTGRPPDVGPHWLR